MTAKQTEFKDVFLYFFPDQVKTSQTHDFHNISVQSAIDVENILIPQSSTQKYCYLTKKLIHFSNNS